MNSPTDCPGSDPSRRSSSPSLPDGLERVIQLAAREPRFRARLLRDRLAAVRRTRLNLTPTEEQLLLAIPQQQLAQIISQTPAPDPGRRSFLRAAFAGLAGLFGLFFLGGLGCSRPSQEHPYTATTGHAMDLPPEEDSPDYREGNLDRSSSPSPDDHSQAR